MAAGALAQVQQLSQLTSVQLLGPAAAAAGLLPALGQLPRLQQLAAGVQPADWQWLRSGSASAAGAFPALESLHLTTSCSEVQLEEAGSGSSRPPQLPRLSLFALSCSTLLTLQQAQLDATFRATHELQRLQGAGAGAPGSGGGAPGGPANWSSVHSAELRVRAQAHAPVLQQLMHVEQEEQAAALQRPLQLLRRALEQLPGSSTTALCLALPLPPGRGRQPFSDVVDQLQQLPALQHLEFHQVQPATSFRVGARRGSCSCQVRLPGGAAAAAAAAVAEACWHGVCQPAGELRQPLGTLAQPMPLPSSLISHHAPPATAGRHTGPAQVAGAQQPGAEVPHGALGRAQRGGDGAQGGGGAVGGAGQPAAPRL